MALLTQDIQFTLRQVRKSSGFAAVAVATLELGIGPDLTTFSLAIALLFCPLLLRDPCRVIWIANPVAGGEDQLRQMGGSNGEAQAGMITGIAKATMPKQYRP